MVPDPEMFGMKRRRFFILLRGVKTPLKKRVLNYSLLLFSQRLIKKNWEGQSLLDPQIFADAQYEPLVSAMMTRCLFAVFSNEQIIYSQAKDFNETGDFHAYFKDVYQRTKLLRPTFATAPNASSFEPLFRQKRQAAIDSGDLDPLENYTHHTWVLLEEINSCWALRASQEVRIFYSLFILQFKNAYVCYLLPHYILLQPIALKRSDFIWGTMKEGDYFGIPSVQLKPTEAEKGNAISLKNPLVSNSKNENAFLAFPMIEDDLFCVYNLLHCQCFEFMPPGCSDDRILRRMATKKTLKVSFLALFWPYQSLSLTFSFYFIGME